MNGFFLTLRNLGPMRLAAIGIVTVALLGFFTFLTTNMTSAPMSLLYSDLDQSDAGSISSRLEQMKIPFDASSDGRTIKVPSDMVGRARMAMAGEGLPRGGNIGYEIFDQKEGFGTSSFVQNINHLRALEGELARTIGTLTPIASARVHLVLPQRELFSRAETRATASVFLKLRGGAALSKEQIQAVQNLIAAAVPQLQPTQISIVDDRGNLLARPSSSDGSTLSASNTQDDLRFSFEQIQARKIEDLLSQTIGFGKVRAQVSAEMDFDRITTQSEIFDPESQVVRSQQTNAEENASSSSSQGEASISSNLPGGEAPAATSAGGNSSNRTEQTINYEINKTVRSQVRESGQIRRLSIAVVVDGTYAAGTGDDTDKQTYAPRTTEEMDKIKSLVKSAVNFDPSRGDTLEVANMQFIQPEAAGGGMPTMDMLFGFPKEDLFRLIQTLILAVVGVLVLLLVVRPLLKRAMETTEALRVEGGGGADMISGGGGGSLPGQSMAAMLTGGGGEDSPLDQMIDVSKVEGRVKSSTIRKVGELVDKHPEESVAILRNWMYQENSR